MPLENEDKPKKILFVINPISGDIDKADFQQVLKAFMDSNQQDFEVYLTSGKDDKKQISRLIDSLKPHTVVAAGGDGTCNLVAQLLVNKNIKLGIIPLGSANGMATGFSLPNDFRKNLQFIINGKSKPIDVLQINNDHISLHLSDVGVNAKIIERFDKGNLRGILGYGKYFMEELKNAKPAKFKIITSEKSRKKIAYMIIIANAAQYGTGAVINPNGQLDDGYFEVIVIRPKKFVQVLRMIIPFFTRKIHLLNFIDIYKEKAVTIENYNRLPLQIDGEIIGQPERIHVEILPHAVQLIVP